MIFGKAMFKSFDQSRSGDRSCDEGNSYRFEGRGRKSLGGDASPETVPVSGDGSETSDPVIADKVINFAALNIRTAVVASAKARITRPRPGFRQALWEILRIGTKVKRTGGVAPDFPGRF